MYTTHTKSCELSPLFQANVSNTMCRRDLLYNYRTPILQQHGKVWFYHFPERRPVTIRCPQANGWITHTASLAEAGQIFNASHCSIITDIRTLPELHGEMQGNIDNIFYIPDQPSIVADHVIPFISETSPEVARLDEIKSKVVVSSQTFHIDSLFHIRQTSSRQAQQTYWHLIVTSTACAIAILSVLIFSLRSYLRNIVTCYSSANTRLKPSTFGTRSFSPTTRAETKRVQSTTTIRPSKGSCFHYLLHTTD